MLNWKNIHPRILYPARLSFRIEGEIKASLDKQNLKEFMTTKPDLQEILKGTSVSGRERTKVTKTRKEQRKSLATVTLEVTQWY